mgnify:CR=1 FL=1
MTKVFKLGKNDNLMIGNYNGDTYVCSDPISIILPEDNIYHPNLYSTLLKSQTKEDFVFVPDKLLSDYMNGFYDLCISESIASYRVKIIDTYKGKTIIRYDYKKYILIDSKVYNKLCNCGYYMYITTYSKDHDNYLYKVFTHEESGRTFYSGIVGLKTRSSNYDSAVGILRTHINEKDIEDISNYIDCSYDENSQTDIAEALKNNPLHFRLAEETFKKLYNTDEDMTRYFINKAFEVLNPRELKEIYKKGL